MFSTLRSMPFRPADRSLASPFLNPITYASFEMVAPEMEPFFLCGIGIVEGGGPGGTQFHPDLASQTLRAELVNTVSARPEHFLFDAKNYSNS